MGGNGYHTMDAGGRRHQRFIVEHLAISAKTLHLEEAELLNISMTGASVTAKESLRPADKHLMKLSGKGLPLTLRCHVIWEKSSRGVRDRSGGLQPLFSSGLAFKDIPPDKLGLLKDFIWVSALPNNTRLSHEDKPGALRFKIFANEKALLYYTKVSHVKELSLTGMLMELDKRIQVGRRFPMGLFLPNEKHPIKVQGRVTCCIEMPDSEQKRFDIGIKFLTIAEKDKSRLTKFLETLAVIPLHEKLRRLFRKAPSFWRNPV